MTREAQGPCTNRVRRRHTGRRPCAARRATFLDWEGRQIARHPWWALVVFGVLMGVVGVAVVYGVYCAYLFVR
jgi:hypothetical protein